MIGCRQAAFVQVGDGAIVISSEAQDWSYVFWPQHGEFANTTNFVVSDSALSVVDFEVIASRVDDVAVFSDGIENLVLHQATKSVHSPFFDGIFAPVRSCDAPGFNVPLSIELEKYLSSPRVCERTDDDKALILATRAPPAEAPE